MVPPTTPSFASQIDKIWDGPRNRNGDKVWVGLDRGTDRGVSFGLDGARPFPLGVTDPLVAGCGLPGGLPSAGLLGITPTK